MPSRWAGNRVPDRRVQPAGDRGRFLLCRQRLAEDDELVTANTGQDVRRPGHCKQSLPDRSKDLIAGVVAVAIIDPLEAVEIDEQDGEDRPVTFEPGECLLRVFDRARLGCGGPSANRGLRQRRVVPRAACAR